MLSTLKFKLTKHKTIISNFSYLSALQVVNMLIPLATYPYLIRVLGKDTYGLVIFAQAMVSYLVIIVNFGFDTSATREISINRNDRNRINEIVCSVFIIKGLLFVLSITVLSLILIFLPQAKDQFLLFYLSLWLCLFAFIFPQWYFLGIEKMKYITLLNLVSRLFFIVLIFYFVRSEKDFLLVPLLSGIGATISGIMALWIVFVFDKNRFYIPPVRIIVKSLKESLPFFGSEFIIAFKDKMNFLFIGTSLSMNEVAVYDLCTKILNLCLVPIGIVNTSIFPKVSISKDMGFVRKTIKYSILFSILLIIIAQFFAEHIVNLLGNQMTEALLPTRIILVVPLVMAISQTLARNCLIVNNKNKIFVTGMIAVTLLYFLLILIGYSLGLMNGVVIFVVITLILYIFELLFRYYFCKKLRLI